MGLWQMGWHPGAFGTLRAVCGLCGRRLTREFCGGISRGKTAWGAVPEQQFCGSNPAVSAGRKKYKIKGGGRKAPTSQSQRPAMRAVSKDCGIPLPCRPRWSVLRIFKFEVVGRAKNPAFPSGRAVSGWRQYFFPLKVQSLRRYIKEKGRGKALPEEFLTF